MTSSTAQPFDLNRYEPKPGGRSRQKGASRPPLGKLFDLLPPHAAEAEMSLLGSMILNPGVVGDVIAHVRSGDAFYSAAHAVIFDAICRNYDEHQSGDLVQLVDSLRSRSELDEVGGADYLETLARSAPSATNAAHYARIVSEKYRLRRLIEAAGEMLFSAYHAGELGPDGAQETLDVAERAIFEIADQWKTSEPELLKDLLHQELERLEASEGRSVMGLPTGFPAFDEMTSGLQNGEMIIIAARPSMGKTALALNIAEQVAMSADHAPVALFSMEMSRSSVTQRLLCARSGVDSHRLRTNRLTEQDYAALMSACGQLGEAPIYVDDEPGMTILQLRARARRMVAKRGVRCIIIDYLQLMTAPGSARESRQVEVSSISRGLKALARELSVPLVCLSQLNRSAEQREGHRPRMSDLRESGSIEQDADVVALLHREEYYHQGDEEWAQEHEDKVGMAELIIAKQRNGPTGIVELVWDARTTRFKSFAGQAMNAAFTPTAPTAPPESRFASGPPPGASFRDGGGPERDFDENTGDGIPI